MADIFSDDKSPNKVIDGLYVGAGRCATLEELKKHGITHVVNCAGSAAFPITHDGIIYLTHEDLFDCYGTHIGDLFQSTSKFIDDARNSGGNVLVHCLAGISRSPSMVIAYLMEYGKMTLGNALDSTRQARPCASPNNDFMAQLLKLYQKLNGYNN